MQQNMFVCRNPVWFKVPKKTLRGSSSSFGLNFSLEKVGRALLSWLLQQPLGYSEVCAVLTSNQHRLSVGIRSKVQAFVEPTIEPNFLSLQTWLNICSFAPGRQESEFLWPAPVPFVLGGQCQRLTTQTIETGGILPGSKESRLRSYTWYIAVVRNVQKHKC